jgi:uncharacterized protein
VFAEPASRRIRELAEDGSGLQVWWATLVECMSAIARRERRGEIDSQSVSEARSFLDSLAGDWIEVPPIDRVRDTARRLVTVHDLRAADAFQLAAAHAASDAQPESLPFVTLDDRLAAAAGREGFPVLP